MSSTRFFYVIYIRTTPERLWRALTEPEFTRAYWCGCHQESEWRAGAAWDFITPDGRIADHGAVIEIDRPRRLVLSWRHELQTPLRDEGETRVSFELEPQGEEVKLSVTHEIDHSPSPLIDALSNGWPPILSSLKSLLETGSSLVLTREWPKGL